MKFHGGYDTPSDLDYSNWEYFECPYNKECSTCEYDCEEDYKNAN